MAKKWISDFFGGEVHYTEVRDPPVKVVEELKASTGHKTYPFIFCGDTFIGGYTELIDYQRTSQILKDECNYEQVF